MTTTGRERARTPEDLTRLFVERANEGDAEGMAELYEPDAVLAFPPGSRTVGREAIRAVCERLVAMGGRFEQEEPLPTIHHGDLALTSTPSSDNTGGRVQVVRRQADGTWLRVIDRPENRSESRPGSRSDDRSGSRSEQRSGSRSEQRSGNGSGSRSEIGG